jgi:hypothetical protein
MSNVSGFVGEGTFVFVLGIKKKRGKMRRDLGNKNDLEEKMKQLQDTI